MIARHPEHVREPTTPFWNASLDHAIWFHDTLKADAFHLYELGCHTLRASRALAMVHTGVVLGTVGTDASTAENKPPTSAPRGTRPRPGRHA